jgi:hypothetical protein
VLWRKIMNARGEGCLLGAALTRRGAVWVGLCAWLVWGVSPVFAAGAPQTRGVLIPIYAEGHPRPVASIRIERVFRDHRRLGFLRVKILPVVVAEGVRLELRDPAGATNLLDEFAAALRSVGGSRAVELRNFRFSAEGESIPRLQARRLRPAAEANRSTFSLEGVILRDGARLLEFATATATPDRPGILRLSARGSTVDYDLSSGHFTRNTVNQSAESP